MIMIGKSISQVNYKKINDGALNNENIQDNHISIGTGSLVLIGLHRLENRDLYLSYYLG